MSIAFLDECFWNYICIGPLSAIGVPAKAPLEMSEIALE